MEERKYFLFYRSFFNVLQRLDDQTRLALYDRITNYAFGNDTPAEDDMVELLFENMKSVVDLSMRDIDNGSKGGRPPKNSDNKNPLKNPLSPIVVDDNISTSTTTRARAHEAATEKEKQNEKQKTAPAQTEYAPLTTLAAIGEKMKCDPYLLRIAQEQYHIEKNELTSLVDVFVLQQQAGGRTTGSEFEIRRHFIFWLPKRIAAEKRSEITDPAVPSTPPDVKIYVEQALEIYPKDPKGIEADGAVLFGNYSRLNPELTPEAIIQHFKAARAAGLTIRQAYQKAITNKQPLI